MNGGWDRGSYAVFLLYGYLIAADRGLSQALGRAWRLMLVITPVATVGFLAGGLAMGSAGIDVNSSYDLGSVVWRAVKGLTGWAWIVVILGYGARPRRASRQDPARAAVAASGQAQPRSRVARALAYASEAFLPFYILRQTVIVIIGYYVVQWQIAAVLKYLVISLSSLGATLLLYEVAVKRTRVTRWLFGMKAQKTPAEP